MKQFRMVQWLVMGLAFYAVSVMCPYIPIQTLGAKLGNVTIASFVAYKLFNHIEARKSGDALSDLMHAARALFIGLVVIAVGLGA